MSIISILNEIIDFLHYGFPWIIAIFPLYLIVRAITLIICVKIKHTKISLKREIGMACFCVYIIFVLSITVFPEVSPTYTLYYPGGGFGVYNITKEYINLIPGNIFSNLADSFQNYGGSTLWISIMGNLMMLLPLGILFSILFTNSIKINLLFGAGLSLLIELYQLFLPRATDIDDLWLNTLGMLIGCLIVRRIRKYKKRRKENATVLSEKSNGLL